MSDDASEPVDLDGAFSLRDRVAIVTGASSGLGGRFARVLAAAGAKVVVAARRKERLDALASELPDALAVATDVADPASVGEVTGAALGEYGRIDILVNNAGISQVGSALDLDRDQFRHELEIDLVAPYDLARGVARHIIERNGTGSIVNIGSVLGTIAGGRLRTPGYCAAKGGLHSLTRSLASEWARKGVRVNALAPGWFQTEMSAPIFSDEAGLAIVNASPMGRAGQVHELDGALVFLCSDASSFMTGQTLHIDGGWTIV